MPNIKLVDAFTDFVEESTLPYRQMMTYYNCALMEVETKFKVLNEQFSYSMIAIPLNRFIRVSNRNLVFLRNFKRKTYHLRFQTLKRICSILLVFV